MNSYAFDGEEKKPPEKNALNPDNNLVPNIKIEVTDEEYSDSLEFKNGTEYNNIKDGTDTQIKTEITDIKEMKPKSPTLNPDNFIPDIKIEVTEANSNTTEFKNSTEGDDIREGSYTQIKTEITDIKQEIYINEIKTEDPLYIDDEGMNDYKYETYDLEKNLAKNHKCETCGKAYSNLKNLKRHMSSVHEGEKNNNKCETCGKCFSRLHSLKIHIRDHS